MHPLGAAGESHMSIGLGKTAALMLHRKRNAVYEVRILLQPPPLMLHGLSGGSVGTSHQARFSLRFKSQIMNVIYQLMHLRYQLKQLPLLEQRPAAREPEGIVAETLRLLITWRVVKIGFNHPINLGATPHDLMCVYFLPQK
jgi:hypothetical protein